MACVSRSRGQSEHVVQSSRLVLCARSSQLGREVGGCNCSPPIRRALVQNACLFFWNQQKAQSNQRAGRCVGFIEINALRWFQKIALLAQMVDLV